MKNRNAMNGKEKFADLVSRYGRQGIAAAILSVLVAGAVMFAAAHTLTAGRRHEAPATSLSEDTTDPDSFPVAVPPPMTDDPSNPALRPTDTTQAPQTDAVPSTDDPDVQPPADTTSRADMETIGRTKGQLNVAVADGETVYVHETSAPEDTADPEDTTDPEDTEEIWDIPPDDDDSQETEDTVDIRDLFPQLGM